MDKKELAECLEKAANKLENDMAVEEGNETQRQVKRGVILDDLKDVVSYLEKADCEGKLRYHVEHTIDLLAKWDPSRFASGDLETSLLRILDEMRKCRVKLELDLRSPDRKTIGGKIRRILKG
jgi:hypothetical protein